MIFPATHLWNLFQIFFLLTIQIPLQTPEHQTRTKIFNMELADAISQITQNSHYYPHLTSHQFNSEIDREPYGRVRLQGHHPVKSPNQYHILIQHVWQCEIHVSPRKTNAVHRSQSNTFFVWIINIQAAVKD